MSKLLQIVSLILAFSSIACHPERYDENSTIKMLLLAILAVAITVPVIYGLVKLFQKMYADTKKKLYEEVKAMLQADAVASCFVPSLYTFTTLRLAASNLSKALYTVLTSSKVTSKSITLTLSHLA